MKEIERKFKVSSDAYKRLATDRHEIKQWYLNRDKFRTVRIRILDDRAYITIKGRNKGIIRDEFEYEIPYSDALAMIPMADGNVIEKTRHIVEYEGHRWEVDEFHGVYDGLALAEIELSSENEAFELPDFVGDEVSDDPKYYNSSLASGSLIPEK